MSTDQASDQERPPNQALRARSQVRVCHSPRRGTGISPPPGRQWREEARYNNPTRAPGIAKIVASTVAARVRPAPRSASAHSDDATQYAKRGKPQPHVEG